MARRGYLSELKAKKELQRQYGVLEVIKVAIGGAQDFIVVSQGRIIKIVEVKEVHGKKYYPTPREKAQIARIIELAANHNICAEMWVYLYPGPGKPAIKQTTTIYNPNK